MKETVLFEAPQMSDKAALYILDKSGMIQSHVLQENVLIGRESASSNAGIRINSPIVSRSHGEIIRMPDCFCYRDVGSMNGTYINGELYGKNAPKSVKKLESGDVLRIGLADRKDQDAVLLLFALGDLQKNWQTQMLTENTGDILIGREVAKDAGVQLHDGSISRRHASFRHGVNGWFVVDHDSTNGVYVNNVRIEQPVKLHRMDAVRIANTTFLFLEDRIVYNADESGKNQLSISIRERSVRNLFKKKVLLKDIDLVVDPGEMVLILGGSGAGKSTFMNAVMGYEKADGEIRHGEMDIYRDFARMKYQIGFVPQQDLMREDDEVLATLDNAARMKLPGNTTEQQRRERIDQVLELLGLQREKYSLVKKLSGGQKKRLSIAIEFISDPSLFFLDEPDSGLDGIMAASLMENLRVIADEGKIVMVITHAPDRVSHLFDKVVVLAKSTKTNSGHLAFYGSIREAFAFFGVNKLEDVVRRINRPDEGGEGLSDYYIEKYNASVKERV